MMALLHQWALAFARRVLDKLSEKQLLDVLVDTAKTRAESLPPADGLKFLFSLDAALYPVQGWLSVAYGGGVHTKHRHTRYHDFFVNRIQAGERVLDVGCGIGALAHDVAAKAGAILVGIDVSAQNIDTANKKHSHPRVAYVVGDVLRSPLKGRFDTVILSNVVEHLQERPAFLREVVNAVRPSRLLLRVPVFERDWRVPLREELGIDYRLDPTHYIEYTLESFATEMKEAGLNITHQEVRWGEIWAEAAPA